ncbi:MAG: trigger factor [Boseongicola sp.]|nr:trigger factor [Boseongicola sp.]
MLEGAWTLTRTISHADGAEHRFDGTAVFRWDVSGLIQDEEGVLSATDGRPGLRATRRYLWREDKKTVDILFEDGRRFHSIPLGVDRPEAVHECPPDTYRVAYDFGDPAAWTARWHVSGPRKDYVMKSRYRRAPGASAAG